MSTRLEFYQTSGVTINFNAAPYQLLEFSGTTPDVRSEEFATEFEDGAQVLYALHNNAVDTIKVAIYGSTVSEVESYKETLDQNIHLAMVKNITKTSKVWLRYQPDTGPTIWLSEILMARVTPSDEKIHEYRKRLALPGIGYRYYCIVNIDITRQPFWEDQSETLIPLTNRNGTDQTAGITVYPHYDADAGHDNFVDIEAAHIGGGLPAPLRITVLNTYNSGDRMGPFYFANNTRYGPFTFPMTIQAEAIHPSGGVTVNPTNITISANCPSETLLGYWDLGGTLLGNMHSRWFRVLVAFNSAAAGYQFRLTQNMFGLTELARTELITSPSAGLIWDMGAMRFPPGFLGGYFPDLRLQLYGLGNISSCTIDWLMFVPIEAEDGYLLIKPEGYYLPYQYELTWNPYDDQLYMEASLMRYPNWVPRGETIYVQPNTDQRFFITWNGMTGYSGNMTASLRLGYHKRRRHV